MNSDLDHCHRIIEMVANLHLVVMAIVIDVVDLGLVVVVAESVVEYLLVVFRCVPLV